MNFHLKDWLREHSIDLDSKFLLAISGGMDSMVLWHQFHKSNLKYGIAHVNYQLREDSNLDLELIKKVLLIQKAPIHDIKFDTIQVARSRKLGIQETARNLRYHWFSEICRENDYKYIVTAHHLDDSIETFLFNLLRGTGIRGLSGIPRIRNNIIRPLSDITKQDIWNYAKINRIKFQVDHSNQKTEYTRNRIRLRLLPELIKFDLKFPQKIAATAHNLYDTNQLFTHFISHLKLKICSEKKNKVFVSLGPINDFPNPEYLLFEILLEYGFNRDQCKSIWTAYKNNHVGTLFYSRHFTANLDRQFLIISPPSKSDIPEFTVYKADLPLTVNLEDNILELKSFNNLSKAKKSEHTEIVDAANIKWPLILRIWKKGDRFKPLGMDGRTKKVKDLLTDLKISRIDKAKTWILADQEKILTVLGHRIDDRIKTTNSTKTILLIRWRKK